MQEEIEVSQEDLNNELKKREREEYYEDKLLELKMKSFLDEYIINHELSNYKSELDELTKEKETLLNEKDVLNQKISEIEEENNNYEDEINNLNEQIAKAENDSKNLDNLILDQQKLAHDLSNEDNLVNHILQTCSESFKKKIYDICSENVNEALKLNNTTDKIKDQKTQKKNKKENNFTVVSSEREEFVSKGEEKESNESDKDNNENETENNKGNIPSIPMMGGYNGQYMMYPYFFPPNMMNMPNMPKMPNMPNFANNAKGNPFYFFPVPMPNMPNVQQNNNINKNK